MVLSSICSKQNTNISYTRDDLYRLRKGNFVPRHDLFRDLKQSGLFRYRSRRGGSHIFNRSSGVGFSAERCSQPPHLIIQTGVTKLTNNNNNSDNGNDRPNNGKTNNDNNKNNVTNGFNSRKTRTYFRWKLGQINIQSCSDDI